MFKTILVPTDGSPLSDKAIDAAVEFAKQVGGAIVAVSVAEPFPFFPLVEQGVSSQMSVFENGTREAARHYVQKAAQAARAANVPCETVVAQSANPYEEIVKAAADMKCDVIFMASHGRKGLSRLFVGSETQKVLAHADIPVLVLR